MICTQKANEMAKICGSVRFEKARSPVKRKSRMYSLMISASFNQEHEAFSQNHTESKKMDRRDVNKVKNHTEPQIKSRLEDSLCLDMACHISELLMSAEYKR